ncbi:MAG: 2-hydroxychromene-2-carboxylate isomerase [Deltaproteobacteria bacterium]|nr:2-hydroxychromene-2-carboxylate isomerase [Deltaproteobacteria bacterium]
MRAFQMWFDFSCPYAYLAATQAEALAARTGAELVPCPMLLGGVFRARETPQKLFATLSPAKARHNFADLQRWANLFGVEYRMPPGHPIRTVEALRCLLAAGQPFMPLALRFFRAYWVEGVDLSTEAGLVKVLSEAGLDADAVLARARTEAVKAELFARTQEAVDKGVFGAPAFFVDDKLYWGQDRLHLVERALGGAPADLAPQDALRYPVDVYFDYSSPFAYLASTRVEAALGAHARWRPMLLGAVFKQVEMVDVPLFAMNEAKRRYTERDLARQAAAAGATLRWPSRFPMNSVLPLRVTLAAGAHETAEGRKLVHRIFRAYWVEDQDISSPDVVRALADEVGLDGAALVAASGTPEVKAALRDATQAAVDAGVFGAPTFVVHPEGRAPEVFWGVDRLELAARAAAGDARLYVASEAADG